MIVAEIIAILLALGLVNIGVFHLVRWNRGRLDQEVQAFRDLRTALKSRDYNQLDDWLILYGGVVDSDVKRHVEIRRDEFFLKVNDS